MTQQLTTLTLDDARRLVAAGEARAAEIGQPMNTAVVDAGGDLVVHVGMDGAWRGSVDVVGAVGVSGGTGEQDTAVCEAANRGL